jgi:hypothetical protein
MGEYTNLIVWAAIAVVTVVALYGAVMAAPAKTAILIDTGGSTARAEMRLLWGLGPKFTARALPREKSGAPLAVFNDPARIGYALMTPGIAEMSYEAVRRVYELQPTLTRIDVGVNLSDTSENTVVLTAVQAALASARAALRERVRIYRCEAPGAEVAMSFELYASPMQINSIWNDFKNSRSAREFRKRLKRKPRQQKRAPKEVRAA